MEKEKKRLKEKSNRMNFLYILQVLKNHSSATRPLSISEIRDYVNIEYYNVIDKTDPAINVSTITRILESLYEDSSFSLGIATMDYYDDHYIYM